MIHKPKVILWTILFFGWWATFASATELPQAFLSGVRHYKTGDYKAAIDRFLKIADAGTGNDILFYNLGNAYLKNGDLGVAILWYERALRVNPEDPDLKFNHEYALSRIKDQREDRTPPLFRIIFFWKHLLGSTTVMWIAIVLNLLFWILLILDYTQKNPRVRTSTHIVLILAMVFIATALYNFYETTQIRKAIVLPDKVSVRSGLTDDATRLFSLHAGTKVTIEKDHNDHFRILFSEGKIGWIKKSDVGVI
ncbi:MAG: tetratricopeptide repeat protein [Desulfobacterales bacterium]